MDSYPSILVNVDSDESALGWIPSERHCILVHSALSNDPLVHTLPSLCTTLSSTLTLRVHWEREDHESAL